MDSYSGKFIALEGIDGSGKTSQIPHLKAKLEEEGYEVYITSEPSSGRLGPILRDYLSDPTSRSEVDALLFAADRVEHYTLEILPQLQLGKIVITDRYKMSSVIYQGLGDVPEDWIIMINNRVPHPDLTILLDLPSEVALERVAADRHHLEKFERLDVLQNLLERYRSLELGQKVLVNANQVPEMVMQEILTAIRSILNE